MWKVQNAVEKTLHLSGLQKGKYGLNEVKIGGQTAIEHGAVTLKKLAQKIDTEKNAKSIISYDSDRSFPYNLPEGW